MRGKKHGGEGIGRQGRCQCQVQIEQNGRGMVLYFVIQSKQPDDAPQSLIPALLRGDTAVLQQWLAHPEARHLMGFAWVVLMGCGLYGAMVGLWRAPMQAVYTAVKLPVVVLLTAFGNALINGMLAPLLGMNLGWVQCLLVVLMSFTLVSAILGAFAPLAGFLVWNAPPMGIASAGWAYSLLLLGLVGGIAYAGIAAHVRLYQLLLHLAGGPRIARKVFLAWLTVNLVLGSQLSWILRPFVGSPGLPVQFLPTEKKFFLLHWADTVHPPGAAPAPRNKGTKVQVQWPVSDLLQPGNCLSNSPFPTLILT
jgi:hypothetical protein